MSRVVTPPTSQTTPQYSQGQGATQFRIPHEKIAMRAYERWVQHGKPNGTELQDWLEAEAELRAEFARGTSFTGNVQQRR